MVIASARTSGFGEITGATEFGSSPGVTISAFREKEAEKKAEELRLANAQTGADLGVDSILVKKAAEARGLLPSDPAILSLSATDIRNLAEKRDDFAIQGRQLQPAQDLTPVEKIEFARGLIEGGFSEIGGVDLFNLTSELVSSSGKEKLDELGIGFDSGEPVTFQHLLDAGVKTNELQPIFTQKLKSVGLTGGANNLSQKTFTTLTEGSVPGAKQIRESIQSQALAAISSLESPEAFLNDPFVQATLNDAQQGVRAAFAGRGLNQSGAAALFEGSQGLQLVEQLRRQRQQEALGLQDQGFGLELGGSLGQFGLGLVDERASNAASQSFLDFQMTQLQRGQEVAARASDLAGSTSQIFKQNVAASGGSLLGNPGNILGGGGGLQIAL